MHTHNKQASTYIHIMHMHIIHKHKQAHAHAHAHAHAPATAAAVQWLLRAWLRQHSTYASPKAAPPEQGWFGQSISIRFSAVCVTCLPGASSVTSPAPQRVPSTSQASASLLAERVVSRYLG